MWLQFQANKHDGAPAGFWQTVLLDSVLIVPGGLLANWLRHRYKQQDEVFLSSITPRPEVASTNSDPRMRAYLVDRAAILAVLLSRAGSEAYLSNNDLPEGMEVITRQTLITFLRKNGLWGKLEGQEVELLSAPDGHWAKDHIRDGVVTYSEQLRLLRWTLQIDLYLPSIAGSHCPDYRQCREFIDRYCDVQNDTAILSSWDLRVARDASEQLAASSLTKVAPAGDVADHAAEAQEQKRLKISFDGARAYTRYEYAAYLTDLLMQQDPFHFCDWQAQKSCA